MKSRFLLLPFVLASLACPLPARALEIAGVEFPESAKLEECPLLLNGTAIRSVWGFKVYIVGLFLCEKNGDGNAIMKEDRRAKRIQISMLREVEQEQFVSTIQENIDKNFSAAEKEKYAGEIAAFFDCFDGGASLKKGSNVCVDFVPGKGMVVGVNDRCFEPIPGDEFYHAILRLWIGQPLQESIREGLLSASK
jgi:hypothetical protein